LHTLLPFLALAVFGMASCVASDEVSDARKPIRVEMGDARRAVNIETEWLDPEYPLDENFRDTLLAARKPATEFCRAHPRGCRVFIEQFTELVTSRTRSGRALLECRLEYERSGSPEICDAGRRMIVRRTSEAEGRVVYIGFETGHSRSPECLRLQECLSGVYSGARLEWPTGFDAEFLAYGQAPWIPAGYGLDPRPLRQRYEALVEAANESNALTAEMVRGVEAGALSDAERFVIEYREITDRAKLEDANAALTMLDEEAS
jgi:hypothetical protein